MAVRDGAAPTQFFPTVGEKIPSLSEDDQKGSLLIRRQDDSLLLKVAETSIRIGAYVGSLLKAIAELFPEWKVAWEQPVEEEVKAGAPGEAVRLIQRFKGHREKFAPEAPLHVSRSLVIAE